MKEIKKLKIGKVYKDVRMSNYNTYKIDGNIKYLVYPDSVENLKKLISYLKEKNIKYKILGKGSNIIFATDYDGVLISLKEFDKFEVKNRMVTVGAGSNLISTCMKVAKLGLTGLEFASGIPGTIGGAIYMNAGAYNSDMGYVVNKVKVLTPNLEIKTLYNKKLDFHYRSSFFQKNRDYICLEATFILKKGNTKAILDVITERRKRRLESQPLEYPSAGSVFRNPENNFAGKLIEDLGYKGKLIGGAKVSEKHANFIINYNKATGKDVVKLIEKIKKDVKETYDIDLKVEQEIVGD